MRRLIFVLSLTGVLLLALSRPALSGPIAIIEDRIYRVEFRDFFGAVMRIEHTLASPTTLEPGQVGALRVVTPYSDDVRRLYYRFTWRQAGEQFQAAVRRDVWTIGSATRDSNHRDLGRGER